MTNILTNAFNRAKLHKRLKTALVTMEAVVATLPYNVKLQRAWKELKSAADAYMAPNTENRTSR